VAGYDLGTARGVIHIDSSAIGTATGAIGGMGKAMVGVGILGVAAFVGVVKSAADLEKTLSAVQAVSGATDAQMARLRETALALGSDTAFSANEIAAAMEDLAKAGISIEDITGGAARAVVDLAAAAGDELPGGVSQGAEIIANAMKTFGASAADMEHFANVLVGAAASSTLNVEDLATSLKYAGPIAHTLGLSIDDLSTTLAILGDRGIKGSTAGTSLRGVLLSLTPTTAKATGVMKDLGIITEEGTNRFYDMNGALKPMPEVMQILGDATKHLSEQEKVAAFNAIFQRRAMNAAMILAEQGAPGFDRYSEAIAGIDASDVAETKLDNLAGDFLLLRNRVDALIKKVGLPLQDMVRGWVQGFDDLVAKLEEVDPELLAQIVMYGAMAAAAIGAVGGILLLVAGFFRMFMMVYNVIQGLQLFWTLLTALAATPVGWVLIAIAVIAALAAAFYFAYTRIQGFRDAVDTAIDGVQQFLAPLQPLWDGLMRIVQAGQELWAMWQEGELTAMAFSVAIARMLADLGLTGDTLQRVRGGFDTLYATITKVWAWIQGTAIPKAKEFIDAINWEPILKGVGIALFALAAPLVALVAGIVWAYQNVGWFRDAVQSTFEWIQVNVVPVIQDLGDLLYALGEILVGIIRRMIPIWQAGLQAWIQIFQWAVRTIQTAWNLFGDNILNGIQNTFNFIRSVIESVLNVIQGIINVVLGLITGDWGRAWEGIKQILDGVWEFIRATIEFVLGTIVLIIQTALDTINLIWQSALDFIANTWGSIWDTIFEVVRAALNGILGFIRHIIDLIITPFQNLYNVLVGNSIIPDLMDRMRQVIQQGLNAVVEFFRSLPGRVISAVQSLVGQIISFANGVMNRFKDAISGGIDGAITFFRNLPGRIIGAIGDLAGTLVGHGEDLIRGLIDGIENMVGSLMSTVGGIAGDVAGGIAGALGIGSPSKLMRQYGQWTVEGFALGLEDKAAALNKTLTMFEPNQGAMGIMPSAATGGGGVTVVFDFSNSTFAPGGEAAVKAEVNNPEMLRKLTNALKAGVRTN
jgi:TP901 family phage tail tape measure protein